MRGAHVYILASKRNGTLYTGMSGDLIDRMFKHRSGLGSRFVWKYKVFLLVYYEWHELYTSAMQRETSLKRWKRAWKIALIEERNPEWLDQTNSLFE
jgi:putative endonuclease